MAFPFQSMSPSFGQRRSDSQRATPKTRQHRERQEDFDHVPRPPLVRHKTPIGADVVTE